MSPLRQRGTRVDEETWVWGVDTDRGESSCIGSAPATRSGALGATPRAGFRCGCGAVPAGVTGGTRGPAEEDADGSGRSSDVRASRCTISDRSVNRRLKPRRAASPVRWINARVSSASETAATDAASEKGRAVDSLFSAASASIFAASRCIFASSCVCVTRESVV